MPPLLASIGLALLPSLVVLIAVFRRAEKKREIAIGFVSGYAAAIPLLLIELLVSSMLRSDGGWVEVLIRAFLVSALVEESGKLLLITSVRGSHRETDRAPTVAVAAVVGLGMATFEQLLYAAEGFGILLLRAATSVPLHVGVAVLMAEIMVRGSSSGEVGTSRRPGKALVAGIAIHGGYDLLLNLAHPIRYAVIPLCLALVYGSVRIIGQAMPPHRN